jgi:hypothetical protein
MCSVLCIRLQDLRDFSLRNENLLGNHWKEAPYRTQLTPLARFRQEID